MGANLTATESVNRLDEFGGAFLVPHPERAADFADFVWVAAQAVGDGAGVVAMSTDARHRDGRPWVSVTFAAETSLRQVAARFGWEAQGTASCVTASGTLGRVVLWLEWFAPRESVSDAEAVA